MESLVTTEVLREITSFVDIAKQDPKAELECKLLSDKIQTKNVVDRIINALKTLAVGAITEEHRLTLSFQADNTRVNVLTPQLIHKVCLQNSFKDVPLIVEQKKFYFEAGIGKKSLIDIPDFHSRFTLKSEREVRRDFDGTPSDPKGHLRILSRMSFKTVGELFRIDFSKVKTRQAGSRRSIPDTVKDEPKHELEIEFIGRKTSLSSEDVAREFLRINTVILQAFYESPFILPQTDIQRYVQEFEKTNNKFYNPVALETRYLSDKVSYNISKDYTATIKADGRRCGLYVTIDRKVLLIPTNKEELRWTGLTAKDDSHKQDFMDGEYIASSNLFCIFDVYRFRTRDTKSLPLMTTDEDTLKNPLKSRLGCAKLFVEDLLTSFVMNPSADALRIESKLFLAGDGPAMEEAINTLLDTKYEYETDGIIFTPRSSGVAPADQIMGRDTWTRVYKWKPPTQNSIDFLVRISNDTTIDPSTEQTCKRGELYVTRNPNDDIVYPRETMTGEYVPKKLPQDLQRSTDYSPVVPSIFQPSFPRDPDAYKILIPVDGKNNAVDKNGGVIKDNTIIECARNIETNRWVILRTRYDKTFQYRVMKRPNYGNRMHVADDTWSLMYYPIAEQALRTFVSSPVEYTGDNSAYYSENVKRTSRAFQNVYSFHNTIIKANLYKQYIRENDTLLEIGCGRGGDMYKIKQQKPSKVVGLDFNLANLVSPRDGACKRYLEEKRKNPRDYLPPTLYIEGDMTYYPLFEQSDKYMPILTGKETAPTPYLAQFEGLTKFDSVSCQFALHYACESEESFRSFAKNLEKYGKDVFFGTCSDGQAIYSLLIGKKAHVFTSDKRIAGEYTKEYADKETWTEEFGMPVKVFLESFEKPAVEYLVPFGKVTEILHEHGYDLVETKMFSDLYSGQTKFVLTKEEQLFSFLNRSFVFKRMSASERRELKEELKEEEQQSSVWDEAVEEKKEEIEENKEGEAETVQEVNLEEIKPKTRKLKKEKEPEPEPVLFHGSDESKGEYRNFSNSSAHPIEVNGVKYPTVEHYYQAMKAKEFNNDEIYEKILKAKTAKAAKALGNKIDVVTEVWDAKRDEIMETGIKSKFVQHPELRAELLRTDDKLIGEADARDMYWGIGTSVESTKSKTPSKWRGNNKIGKILMALRKKFKEELS